MKLIIDAIAIVGFIVIETIAMPIGVIALLASDYDLSSACFLLSIYAHLVSRRLIDDY